MPSVITTWPTHDFFLDVQEPTTNFIVSLYPNPTSDFIKINSTSNQKLDIVLCNIYGQTILNTQNSTIDVSEIPKGSYVLIVSSGESISKQKIIIQ